MKKKIYYLIFFFLILLVVLLQHIETFEIDNKTYIYSNYNKNNQGKVISFDVVTSPFQPNSQSHL
jgi:hypothetical protein